MKFTVQYIPLRKIKLSRSAKVSERLHALRFLLWDCLHLLAVRQSKKGEYIVVCGRSRYEHLRQHTSHKLVPCIVEEPSVTLLAKCLRLWGNHSRQLPSSSHSRLQLIRQFREQEPRFGKLSMLQRMQVLLLAVRYKRTILTAMQEKTRKHVE